jgi:type I restriction enzyme S subunit
MLAEALGTLDDKIELNKQMCKTLEAIGKAIFKHWFIDFEFPNEEGRPYKSSGGEMVYNEELEKEIPKGWEISNVNKEFNLVMGQSPPGSSYNETGEGVVFFQGRTDFGHRFPSIRMFCTEPTRFAKKGDTLISVRAPVGDANLALQDCCIGRGLAAIRHKSDYSSYTYYLMMTLKPTFDHFEAQGTVFGSLSKADFEKIKVLAPSKEIINRFQNTVGSIDKKIEDNTLQTLTLSSIRDSLLPKLMSGRIRVPVKVR